MKLRGLRPWLLERLPAGLLARPAEWLLAVFCLFGGITIVTGLATPRSVARLLPHFVYLGWGAGLILGGMGLVCGLSSYRRAPGGWIIRRFPCYRFGLRMLGMAAGMYTFALLFVGRLDGIPAALFTLAFALMCVVRLLTLEPRQ